MGIALAKVAAELGANVKLILGPTNHSIIHSNIEIINVLSADHMYDRVLANFSSIFLFVNVENYKYFRNKLITFIVK